MRSILLVLTVALMMAAMLAVMAAPAFAIHGGVPAPPSNGCGKANSGCHQPI